MHEPAISTAALTRSSIPAVVTLCGIVTERAADVAERKQRPQKRGVMLGLDAHRHDNRVDAALREPRIVDHRRGEALGRIAEMRDDLGPPADHRAPLSPLRGAQPGIEPPRDARRLGRADLAARQGRPDPANGPLNLRPRADPGHADTDPLGRILRRDRRQELAQEPPQQPGLAAEQRLAGFRVFPKGLQRHRAPLRVGDAARPPPGIAGLARGEPAGLVAGLIQGRGAGGKWQKIRSKRLILLDSAVEMQQKAARSSCIGNHFRHLAGPAGATSHDI